MCKVPPSPKFDAPPPLWETLKLKLLAFDSIPANLLFNPDVKLISVSPLLPTEYVVLTDEISIVLPDLVTVVAPLSVKVIVSPEPIASEAPVFALILNEP